MFIESLKVRLIIISLSIVLGLIYFMPNIIPFEKESWWPSKNKLVYGLDIQGGLHLVLAAEVNEILQERLSRQGQEIKTELEKEGIKSSIKSDASSIFINLEKEGQLETAASWLKKSDFITNFQILRSQGREIKLSYYQSRVKQIKEDAIQQSIEVIRSRIDEFGVSEPVITAQGEDRILVQLPGIEDSKRAKDLIQRTARLELAIVNKEFPPEKLIPLIQSAEKAGGYSLNDKSINYRQYVKKINQDLKDQLPENSRLLFEKAPSALTIQAGSIPYLVDMNQSVQGSLLEDASVAFDPDTNNPLVSF